jgi:DNA-binding transcriptional ArsR family regulator
VDDKDILVLNKHFVQDRTMSEGPDFTEAAALMGDPARARMLTAMLDGRAWTATELAFEASVAASTASAHLARLLSGGLVSDVRQGRHRYFRLMGSDVATAIEALMALSTRTSPSKRLPGPRDERLRYARTCYDHLAGTLGVQMFGYLSEQGWIVSDQSGWVFTADGETGFAKLTGGSKITLAEHGRSCLDWSERREHLGGALGKTVLSELVNTGLASIGPGRLVELTPSGRDRLAALVSASNGRDLSS